MMKICHSSKKSKNLQTTDIEGGFPSELQTELSFTLSHRYDEKRQQNMSSIPVNQIIKAPSYILMFRPTVIRPEKKTEEARTQLTTLRDLLQNVRGLKCD